MTDRARHAISGQRVDLVEAAGLPGGGMSEDVHLAARGARRTLRGCRVTPRALFLDIAGV